MLKARVAYLLHLRARGYRWSCLAGFTVLWLVLALPNVSSAALAPHPIGPASEVTVLRNGVVWVDEGRVLFQGFWSGTASLGAVEPFSSTLASSDTSVAVTRGGGRQGFAAGAPPRRLAPVEQIYEGVRHGDCSSWVPLIGYPSDFAVARDQLVDGSECQGEIGGQEATTSEPLFVRNIRGGAWHILRWLDSEGPPILATEGNLLAIGVQLSSTRMRVTILDVATAKVAARFDAPDGYLSFASPHRLVLSVQLPVAGFLPAAGAATRVPPLRRQLYRSELYSVHGRRLADLGTTPELPLVSNMHRLVWEIVEGRSVLAVRNLLAGPSRRLIGFSEPARSLRGLAFRWPAVAVVETTSAPLAQSEVTCHSGEYHHPSPPFLAIFELERSEPFVPAPPPAHLALPAGNCPPPIHVVD
ncbi:MAG TPA: hypothetical protein VGN08_08710 [Solirubrobacteraceae bacterium]